MRTSRLAAALLVVVAGSRAVAAPPTAAAVIARVEASAKSTRSLVGEFTQKSKVKLFKQELASKGRFVYEAPRRIRWEYIDPDPSTLLVDGDTATMRAPGSEPQRFDLAKDPTMRALFDSLFVWLGTRSIADGPADQDYDLAGGGTDAAPTLVITPRAGTPMAKAIAKVELRFGKNMLPAEIRLVEPSGDEKDIAFTRLERNAKVPADAFK